MGKSRPITQAINEREEQTQQHGTLKLFAPVSIFKKGRKIKIQEQFFVRLTSQTSLLLNMSRDVSPKCVSVLPFNYRRNLAFFP